MSTSSTYPGGLPQTAATWAKLAASAPASKRFRVPVLFTGSGSEYFRIWIVNQLLTILTLGFYYPWAKVRRLRYFYGNTHIGEHTLAFHGKPMLMLRGVVLLGGLALLYAMAGNVSPTAGLVAFAVVAVILPALFRAGQRFRLANTSWRGLRLRFTGTLAGAYVAMLPMVVPAGLFAMSLPHLADENKQPVPGKGPWIALIPLVGALLVPLCWYLLKKYQHGHYAFADNRASLRTGAGPFYAVFVKALGLVLLIALCTGMAGAVLGGGAVSGLTSRDPRLAGVVIVVLLFMLAYLVMFVVLRPYLTSRLQNLAWNATRSTDIAFVSALPFMQLLILTVKNWLLILITFGLYFPFASIAMARLRLESVTVHFRVSPAEFASRAPRRFDDATGEAAGDLFGIDIGL